MSFFSKLLGKQIQVASKTSLEKFCSAIELIKIIEAYESGKPQTPGVISLLTLYTVHRFCSSIYPALAARYKIEKMMQSEGFDQEISYDIMAFESAVYCHYFLLKEYLDFDDLEVEDDFDEGTGLKKQDEYYDTLMVSAQVTNSLIEKDTQFGLPKDYFLKTMLMFYGRPTRSGDTPDLAEVMLRFEKHLIGSIVKGLPTSGDITERPLMQADIKPYILNFHSSYLNPLSKIARNIFDKTLVSKNIRQLLTLIAEAADKLNISEKLSFQMVRIKMEAWAFFNQSELFQTIRDNCSGNPRAWIYATIGNITGDLLETGNYHVYRGLLNPAGDDLLKIFDASQDELLQMTILDKKYVTEQKEGIRKNIKEIG